MRVLFLEIDHEREWAVASIGPAFLGAYLRRHGHEVAWLRVPAASGADEIAREVGALAPGLIGVSLTTRQWQRARQVIRELRERMNVPVVAGGLHPTFAAEEVLANQGFDFACLGEGEGAMLDLVNAIEGGLPTQGLRNVWTRGGDRPELRKPFEPIDDLPFMARDLLDERHGVLHVATQRGCPFPCTYCAARMYDELYEGTGDYGRRRSHANVLEELQGLRDSGALNYVIFLDDTFTLHHPWVKEFCRVYGERLRVPFSLHARVETVNEDMLKRLADAGCRHVTYGVESGSERVRREIMRRPVPDARFEQVFSWTRDAGIIVTANYILGTPGETKAEMEQTLALHERLAPDDFGYFVFYPYPGTSLFRECLANGWLPTDYLDRPANHRETILDLPGVTKQDVAGMYARWTDVREREALRRQQQALDASARLAVAQSVRGSAALG